ncbi:MAG: DUF2268 domain-containing putative Zn-dependent protease [Bacteroidales bacterium]
MKKKPILIIVITILIAFIIGILIWHFSNKNETNTRKFKVKKTELSQIKKKINIKIHRYEIALFSLDLNHLSSGIEKLSHQYPETLIEKGIWNNPNMISQLKNYLQDPVIQDIYKDVTTQYPKLDDIEKELNNAFSYYLTYYPNETIPEIYSLVPGIDMMMPSVYAYQNDMFINLDMYLGVNNKFYQLYGMPKYISERCEKKYIAPDCFKKAMVYKHLPEKTLITLLDNMIYEGKKLYFTELMFPNISEANIIGYSDEKYNWASQNHGKVWNYVIEKNLLFSKDAETVRKYVEEAPFTKPFSNSSPGRMGVFIGWKIIQGYMENNPNVSLQDLMQDTDSQKILNKSKYKPLNR